MSAGTPNALAAQRGLKIGSLLQVQGFDEDGDPLCEVVEAKLKIKPVKKTETKKARR